MTNHQEALHDLVTGMGWELFEQHALADLNDRLGQVLANANNQTPADAGLALREHLAVIRAVRALLIWPKARAAELAKQEQKQERRPH